MKRTNAFSVTFYFKIANVRLNVWGNNEIVANK